MDNITPKQTTRIDADKITPDEIIDVLSEKLDVPAYEAKKIWKAVIGTIRESLLSGHEIMLPKIGKIELRKSRYVKRGDTITGGNVVAKMRFNPMFRKELRSAQDGLIGGEE